MSHKIFKSINVTKNGWVYRFFLAYIFIPWTTMTKMWMNINERIGNEWMNEWTECSQCIIIMGEDDAFETILGRDNFELFL